jgi:hypothetical protein
VGFAEMTKDRALFEWFQQFGMPFYPVTALPPAKEITFPYGTYEPVFGYNGDITYPTVNIYYLTESEVTPNKKAAEIGEVIGMGGTLVKCDEGLMWIKRGSPFVQGINDPDNSNIKRRLISIAIEFITTD